MRYERAIVGSLQCVRCDCCGDVTEVGATIEGQQFDPRSRASGPPPHPFLEHQHACYACAKAGEHLGGRSVKPPGMLIAQVYEVMTCSDCHGYGTDRDINLHDPVRCSRCYGHGRRFLDDAREDREQTGLRLPERPYTEAEWERVVRCGVLLHPTRTDCALLFTMRDYWWCAAYVFDGSRTSSSLAGKESVVLFVEPSQRTPFRTVYEARMLTDAMDVDTVRVLYGAEAAERTHEYGAVEVALRVPMEILQ